LKEQKRNTPRSSIWI